MTLWTELGGSDLQVRYVDVGSWRTRVIERGTGPALIILHGTGGHAEAFVKNLPALGDHLRVIVYDLPGHGWSTLANRDLEIVDYIVHLTGLMDALDIESAYLSGESLGGWVAAKFAAANPRRVRGLILNTPGGTMANPDVMERIRSLSQAAADDPSYERIRARLEWLMADPASVTDELVEIRQAIYSRPGFPSSMAYLLCLQDPEIRRRNLLTDEELAAIVAPTIVIWTTDDPSGPPDAGVELAGKIVGSEFKLIERAGHWPQWEQQEEFDATVLDFIRRARELSAADPIVLAAERLLAAADAGVAGAPVRDLIGATDIDAAYRVQQRIIAEHVRRGARVIGRKIGLTSEAIQQQVGVDRPDFGVLMDVMSYVDGDIIPISRLLQPRCEAEVAFVLDRDLVGNVDDATVRAAIGYAVAAVEIVDSRVENWQIVITDTVADNASSGAFVLGTVRMRLSEFEPADVRMTMTRNGELVSQGDGKACLGDPLNAVAWLAQTAIEQGDPLRAGDIVLSGALGPMVPVRPGDTFEAVIEPFGSVTARFSE